MLRKDTPTHTRAVTEQADSRWYAVKTYVNREFKLKKYLDEHDIENYIATRYIESLVNGRKKRKLVPAVSCLVFVKTGKARLLELQTELGRQNIYIYYDHQTKSPQVIPDSQINAFILITSTHDNGLEYVDPLEISHKVGDRVRVTGGLFAGAEGRLVRIKNRKRLVVTIEGVAAVATAYIPNCYIEKIA